MKKSLNSQILSIVNTPILETKTVCYNNIVQARLRGSKVGQSLTHCLRITNSDYESEVER